MDKSTDVLAVDGGLAVSKLYLTIIKVSETDEALELLTHFFNPSCLDKTHPHYC